jgi:hypothetical protein
LRLWITAKEAAPHLPHGSHKAIYESIREGRFPFKYKRDGRAILIFAPDLGITPDTIANKEAQEGDQSFDAAAPAYA